MDIAGLRGTLRTTPDTRAVESRQFQFKNNRYINMHTVIILSCFKFLNKTYLKMYILLC